MQETTDKHPIIPPQAGAPTRGRFIADAQAQLQKWGHKVEELAQTGERLSGDARVMARNELAEMKLRLAAAHQKLEASKSVGHEKWEEAKAGLEAHWNELKALFDKRSNPTEH